MDNTNEQFSDLLMRHLERGNGLQDLTELTAGSMMSAERGEFLRSLPGNKGNGFRPGHTYGMGRRLEFRIRATRRTSANGSRAASTRRA